MSITKKLLLINGLICIAFIAIILVVFISFRNVERVLTDIFTRETNRIVESSNAARELTRVLANMNLILSTFYKNNEVLKTDGKRMLNEIRLLMNQSADLELKEAVNRFARQIAEILIQCDKVNLLRRKIENIENRFDTKLASLDDVVAQRLVELIVKGENTTDTEQLSSLIGGYYESFLRIELQFVHLGLDHFKHPITDQPHPLYALLDDLHLRLRTLTASIPVIAGHGRELIRLIQDYKQLLPKFHQAAGELQALLHKMTYAREYLLSIMEKTDRQVEKKTGDAMGALRARIEDVLAMNFIIFLGILPFTVLAGLTANSIKKPVQKVIETIELLARGESPSRVKEIYKGEFNRVKDNLNILIDATDDVTHAAEQVASGNVDILIQERSGNDRLMQALNSMIQSLRKFQDETDAMIRAVGRGELDIHGNADEFEGGWSGLVAGVNNLIEGLRKAVSTSAALNHEMALAKQIQTALLPESLDNIHPDLEIAAAMAPADQVGGDFYDITLDRTGSLWTAIGDVSGHGVTPGLIMMMAQTAFTAAINEPGSDAKSVVVKTNDILYKNVHNRLGKTHFMTFSAIKHLGSGRFQHAGAHLSMMIYRREASQFEFVKTSGVYLNLINDISHATEAAEFCLGPGDILILYTDGLTEAKNPKGDILDLSGFQKIVKKNLHNNIEVTKQMIFYDVEHWCSHHRSDDMSLVIIKRKEISDG